MVVEDDERIRKMMESIFKSYSFSIKLSSCLKEAFEVFKKEKDFDLVISDYRLPDGTGIIFAEEAFKINPNIKVLIATGYELEKIPEINKIKEKGVVFIDKPFTPSDILNKIIEMLEL